MLGFADVAISNGAEDRVTNEVKTVSGAEPVSFEAFAERDKAYWG